MKKSTQSQNKTPTKKVITRSSRVVGVKKNNVISRITSSTKRYGKQTLRELLLSKTFHTAFKIVIGLMISSSAMYAGYAYMENTLANDVVVSKSEIIARIAKHTTLPNEEPEAVVRVQDAETLKKQNDFYENVKEGDYIVVYPKLAVIYDLLGDSIVAMKKTER